MAGYNGFSMSNNACAAYGDGRMPISKWTRAEILSRIESIRPDSLALFQKVKVSVLKDRLLSCSEWHHTSSWYNKTKFYKIDEDLILKMTEDDIREMASIQSEPKKVDEPNNFLGTIHYLEWSGTRKHPHASEMVLEDVQIEERGCFYICYRNGKEVLRKKTDSRGTWIERSNR